ncbi:VOC family protein [Candidatus Parcubacteria bacterium]|nr:MAG: VOC family protein [Candidatus Parcubacteria bacterium]
MAGKQDTQKITPCLWFYKNCEEAMQFYTATFKNSKNPGHTFTFNEAVSLSVECEDQQEVDYFWEKMSAHPENEQCGWLKDTFGVSWQIVPKRMGELLSSENKGKSDRALQAMLQMKKIDVAALEKAYEGK